MPNPHKHALLFFSKPPVPGLVKTRLTRAHGGIFSETDAADFYHRSMFDVMELCLLAVDQLEAEDALALEADAESPVNEYSFFISSTPAENVEIMQRTFEDAGVWPREFTYILDEGANFDEHFDSAFQQIFDLGFDSILSVGGDIPMIPREHVVNGFRWLQYFMASSENGGVIQAPCQECGVSLIGWTRNTPIDHQGVFYDMAGRPALDAYVAKCSSRDIPLASLTPVADIDDMGDLAHAISMAKSARYGAKFQPDLYVPHRFLEWVEYKGLRVSTPPNEDRDSREGIDGT